MIVLDENIPEDQRQLLRSWRVRVSQIGEELGRKGMKDDQIIPLLRKLASPTLVRRVLRHTPLNTKAKRLGCVVRADHLGIEIKTAHEPPVFHPW